MEQDQLDELEAICAIFPEEYSEVSEEQAEAIISSMGWGEDDIKHMVKLTLQPQPDDKGDIHGKTVPNSDVEWHLLNGIDRYSRYCAILRHACYLSGGTPTIDNLREGEGSER